MEEFIDPEQVREAFKHARILLKTINTLFSKLKGIGISNKKREIIISIEQNFKDLIRDIGLLMNSSDILTEYKDLHDTSQIILQISNTIDATINLIRSNVAKGEDRREVVDILLVQLKGIKDSFDDSLKNFLDDHRLFEEDRKAISKHIEMMDQVLENLYGAVEASQKDPSILTQTHSEWACSFTNHSNELLRISNKKVKYLSNQMSEISSELRKYIGGEYNVK